MYHMATTTVHAMQQVLHWGRLGECQERACHVCCLQAGIAEIKKRLVVAPPHYAMKVVDKNGVREVKKV